MLTRRRITSIALGAIGVSSILSTIPAAATAQTTPGHDRQASISATESHRAPDPITGLDQLKSNQTTDMPAAASDAIGLALVILEKASTLPIPPSQAMVRAAVLQAPQPQPPPPPPVPAPVAATLPPPAPVPAPAPASTPTGNASGQGWDKLRNCESGGNYSINTGNGFYGAYQFDVGTWGGYGHVKYASDAPPSTQDAKAQEVYNQRGSEPWPQCGRFLG